MANNAANQTGWHTVEVNSRQFTLPARYTDPVAVGQGAFGAVIRATDRETGKYVAIKKMLDPFRTDIHAKRAYRELKLLMYLNHPDAQIVQLYNAFTPETNVQEFRNLYFVLNFIDFNLNQIIRPTNPFGEDHIKQIIYSLLRGLKFMHSAGVVHRDLKPANIGVDRDSNVSRVVLKILDFGLARILTPDPSTVYVTTRWWRAPEICINEGLYDNKVDVWSVGCIMGQLILLRVLFQGKDNFDQITKIFELVGLPNDVTLTAMKCTPAIIERIKEIPNLPRQDDADFLEEKQKKYEELFGYKYNNSSPTPTSGISLQGIDLLDRLLTCNPENRPTAAEAIAHQFFEAFHDPMEEPTTEPLIEPHENAKYSVSQWKNIIWQMIEEFLPPSWVTEDSTEEE